ncbi:MAG: glycosyltransferase [Hyphomicrobium sp.]
MRILFVHNNFPGQFKNLAPALIERGHTVVGLTPTTNPNTISLPAVKYTWRERRFEAADFRLAETYAQMTRRGEAVAAVALELRDRHNFVPDVVFGTPGWGETLFLRTVWPDARHLLYGEFYYGPDDPTFGFDPEFSTASTANRIMRTAGSAHLVMASVEADKILTPTQWQARSHPAFLQDRISVIHEGIDTAFASPDNAASIQIPETSHTAKAGDEILTFINRNLEPARGFHIFMRALPAVLDARPNARAVIVGGDGHSYSNPPPDGKSWKQIILDEVGDRLDMSRVHFTGKIPYRTFIDLMKVTRVHAYLTYPFVLSWSMLEAMSAGAFVIGSRTPPVEEVISDGVNGQLVDFFDVDGWSRAMIAALSKPEDFVGLREAARRTIVERYDLRTKCLPAQLAFVETAR